MVALTPELIARGPARDGGLAVAARRLGRSPLLRYGPVLAVVALLLVWPLVMLVIGSFRSAPPGFAGAWTLAAWREAFAGPATAGAIGNSVIISVVSTIGATTLAAGLAFLSERTDAPLRRWITPGLVLMFATPGLFYAMGYALLGNAYTGLLNNLFQAVTGIARAPIDIETWPGLLTVLTLKKVAVIYLFLIGPFRALDPVHDEASLLSGAGPITTFLKINLPLLAPALTGAILLGIVSGLQAFDMVMILGWPFDLQVLTTRIFEFVNEGATPQFGKASVLSLGLLGVVAVLSLVQARVLGSRSFVTVGGKSLGSRRIALRGARWLFGGLIGLYLLAAAVLPVGAVLFSSLQRFPGVYNGLSLQNYADVLAIPRLLTSLQLTLVLALLVGFSAMVLAVLVVQAGRAGGPRTAALLRFATFIPLAMPGVVTALAIAWAFLSLPGLKQLYGTVELVGLALVVCVIPFAVQAANAAIVQIAPELQEAAATSGAAPHEVLLDVVLRLIAPSFLVGWFMTAILVSGNLEVPLLLKAPGEQPVAAVIYDLNSRGEFGAACALLAITLFAKGAVALLGYGAFRSFTAARRWRKTA